MRSSSDVAGCRCAHPKTGSERQSRRRDAARLVRRPPAPLRGVSPPTFSQIKPTKRQQDLIDEPPGAGWSGIEGVAGSGKSLVLARRASRLVRDKQNVLLITFNLTLANYCRALADDAPERYPYDRLTVQHFHGLCHALLRTLNEPAPLHPDGEEEESTGPPPDPDVLEERTRDHFETRWPTVVARALARHGRPPGYTLSTIFVDEAQDFSPAFFEVLSALQAPQGGGMLAFDRAQRLYAREDGIKSVLDMRRVKKLGGTRRLRMRHAQIASSLGVSTRLPTERIELDRRRRTTLRG